jgi:hypothetical protein
LNAWLGGFESSLSKMTANNFNWFLHVMLFMHALFIIEQQEEKKRKKEESEENEEDNREENEEVEEVEENGEGYEEEAENDL